MDDGDNFVSGLFCLVLTQTGTGDFEIHDLGHGGADNPGECGVAATHVGTDDASLLIRVGAEWCVYPVLADQMPTFYAVSAGPDVFQAFNTHAQVRAKSSFAAQRQARCLGKRSVRFDAKSADDDVGRHFGAVDRDRCDVSVCCGGEPVDLGLCAHVNAHTFHGLVHQAAHIWIQCCHGLFGLVHHRHADTAVRHRFGHFDADVATAHYDDALGVPFIEVIDNRSTVVKCLHPEDANCIDTGQIRSDWLCSGCDDEVIKCFLAGCSGIDVARFDGLRVEIDRLHFDARPHVNAVGAVLFGRPSYKVVAV